jgi:hypothetical protein
MNNTKRRRLATLCGQAGMGYFLNEINALRVEGLCG